MVSFHTVPCKGCGQVHTFSSVEPWVCSKCSDAYYEASGLSVGEASWDGYTWTEEADRDLNPDDYCYECEKPLIDDEDFSSKHVGQCASCFDKERKEKGLG